MKVTIGKCRLPELLSARRMTQRRLSELTGLSPKQISHYVTKHQIMSLKNAKIIAGVLRCKIDDLYVWHLGGDE